MSAELMTDRVLYFPYMNDASYMIAAAARACGVESYSLPMQTNEELALARKYLSSRECFPMICTTGSFLKKLQEPGIDPAKVSFFMPDHNGPCRFGQYNRLQKIIFDRLGYKNVKITSPSNDSSYEDIVGKNGRKFRFLSWKGFVAIDLLRKLLQERRPYELITGMTDKVYQKGLKSLEECIENGGNGLKQVLRQAALEFNSIPFKNGTRKPVIAVLGEIFMRDNSFCNGFVIKKLEALGAETLVSPFSEWLTYSTYRYARDSKWKGNTTGLIKAHIQKFGQQLTHRQLLKSVSDLIDLEKEVEVEEMLRLCNPYVHKDYDGDPPLAMGTAVALADREISGICNILPFTCMPATILTAVSNTFRKDHNKLPWVDVAYDGQEAASLQTQLESFMHQAHEYSRINKFDQPENWVLKKIEDRNNHYPVSTPF
jgi:predicted nucleotide-binding protein (sugar kinase/HSP70/actin superfamily)